MKKIHTLLWCCIAWSATHGAWAETLHRKLDNGMQIIVSEDHRSPVVLTQLWYKIGSMDEVAGKTGLSHALEHMMFKGTDNVPAGEYSRQISALGGNENAYTSPEETVYHVTIAAPHLEQVLRLEADRMVNLNFNDDVFNNEMNVIREERRQVVEDNPHARLYEILLGQAWQKIGNRTHTIGVMADLHNLQAADLRQWYRQWYAPNNATLVIVGDVDATKTLDLAEHYFGKIPARKLPARTNNDEIMQRDTPASSHTGQTQQPLMMLGFRVPHLQKLDDTLPYALDMLVTILDGHSAARFSRHLIRGSQIAQNIDISYNLLSRQPQMWTISAMPAQGVSLPQLRAAIEAQIDDIAKNGVSAAELQRAITQEQTGEIYGRDSMHSRAYFIGTLENVGFSYRDETEIRRRLTSVTPEQVQAAAQLLSRERAVYAELLPESNQ